jgi:prepilin-type N-terminal cleavage/methylation domain-containing protein
MRTAEQGYTIIELIVVLTIAGVVLAVALPRVQLTLDRLSVAAAASDVRMVIRDARSLALASRQPVAVDIVRGAGTLRVWRDSEAVMSRAVAALHQVDVSATRDSLAYDARGLGFGAANLSIVIRRRSAVETVFVSRLGRVR